MTPDFPPNAKRQAAIALAWLFLSFSLAAAREFNVQTLSDAKGNARSPSIGETGLVAWQAFLPNQDSPLSSRTDIIATPSGSVRSDVYVWRDGKAENVTAKDLRILGRNEHPSVFRDSVIFTAWFKNNAGGGYPFELTVPPKNDEMRQMEAE